jgi:predicted metal-binding membrane protein
VENRYRDNLATAWKTNPRAALVAYAALKAGQAGGIFTWDGLGQPMAVGALLAAALYEMTPLKTKCLLKCRSPLGFLLSSWRDGLRCAFTMGTRHGAWCLGCCWALMVALFALGVMSLTWMLVVSGLIAAEKLLPWGGDGRRIGGAACGGDGCCGGPSERAVVDRTDGRTYVMV